MKPPRPPDPFRPLYDEHFPFVRALARRMGVRDADVPDVVQEAFGALARRVEKGLDTAASLRPYVRRVVVSRALNWKRLARNREQPHAAAEAVEAMADARACEEPMETSISLRACVDAVLERLPRDQRVVLVMADLEEMPSDEVAELLGISTAAMYSRLYRAREAFARAWNEQRAAGLAAFAPFALWDARSLLANDRAIPTAPPELQEEVWRRLVASGAATMAGAGAGAAGAKAAVLMTAKQLLVGGVLAALAGAGIHAALTSGGEERPRSRALATVHPNDAEREGPAVTATTTGSGEPVPSSPVAVGSTSALPGPSAAPPAGAATTDAEANERHVLDSAQVAITRGDWVEARAALARVKSARNADERDYLLGIVRAYEQDGGSR
jgi:RNA polymerase sigma-70 factor (ECF subfamily)